MSSEKCSRSQNCVVNSGSHIALIRAPNRHKFPGRSGSQWALIRAPGRKSLLVDRGDHELWLELTMVMGLSVDWGGNELWGELPITKVCWSPYQCSSQSPIPYCDHDYRLKNGLSLKYTDKTKRESELRNTTHKKPVQVVNDYRSLFIK